MSVDTKAIIRKGTTIEQIEKVLSYKYENVEIVSSSPDFMYITFKDGDDDRTLAVSFTNSCERDNGIAGVWLSLGKNGNSIEIMKHICNSIGGYIDEDDCDEEGFYPVNYEEYSKGEEFTKLDEFRHKVIAKLGHENLKVAMELIKEYSETVK